MPDYVETDLSQAVVLIQEDIDMHGSSWANWSLVAVDDAYNLDLSQSDRECLSIFFKKGKFLKDVFLKYKESAGRAVSNCNSFLENPIRGQYNRYTLETHRVEGQIILAAVDVYSNKFLAKKHFASRADITAFLESLHVREEDKVNSLVNSGYVLKDAINYLLNNCVRV